MDANLPEAVDVTPEMARDWLGFNTHNRPLRARTVAAYATDMRNGHWQWNGESVKFAKDGTLLDGQHRLAAIAEAAVTVPMLVIRDLPDFTQETVDGGVKRTFADVLALRGETSAHALAAIVRRVAIWESTGLTATRASLAPTNAQMLQTLERYPWLRDATKSAQRVASRCELSQSIIGFLMWRFTFLENASDDIGYFFDRLADFQGLQKGDPIYELRRTLESTRSVRGARSDVFLSAITIKAWNAFRGGKEVAVLGFKPGGARPEKFPEPI